MGARGHVVTPLQRTVIALQACVPVLNLDLALYDDFESVIVYSGEFVPGHEWEDEFGVVHKDDGTLAGEAMPRGPVVLPWPDVEASADWEASGMNLVIHEFAHKIDMRDGNANGCPPLRADVSPLRWQRTLQEAFDDFSCGVSTAAKRRRSTLTPPRIPPNSLPCCPRYFSSIPPCSSRNTRPCINCSGRSTGRTRQGGPHCCATDGRRPVPTHCTSEITPPGH